MAKVFISPENRPKPHGKYAGYEAYEHDVCYEIAYMTEAMLKRHGIDVIIPPRTMTLGERIKLANANGVDLSVSLHSNGHNGLVRGQETMYSNKLANYPAHVKESKRLCELIHAELLKPYDGPDRGVRPDYQNFAEIRQINAPTSYVELAFHDNPFDARYIMNNKEVIAEALCRGICAFLGVTYQDNELRSEIERLEQEIALRDEQTGELHDRIDRLNDEIAAKDDEIATREQQTREVEAKVAALKAKAAQMQMLAAEMLGV
jgi:N-acetylmuramoyl-L-alanine amidase